MNHISSPSEDISRTAFFTGHRYIPADRTGLSAEKVYNCISDAYISGYRRFFCGCALGFDTIAAFQTVKLRKQYPDVILSLAVPCASQPDRWTEKDKEQYRTILNLADDAARANWGGQWRMPTKADFEELKNNTNSEWVYDYNGTGVAGRRFTADNGNHIFLPVTGYRNGTSLHNTADGYYWSSSLSTDDPDIAYELNVSSRPSKIT